MRNVVKGFQFSQMAVPRTTHLGINASFSNLHTQRPPRIQGQSRLIRMAPKSTITTAKPVGKNLPGRRGFKV